MPPRTDRQAISSRNRRIHQIRGRMIMQKKTIVLLGLMLALGAAMSLPAFAAQPIQGSVAEIDATNAAGLGTSATSDSTVGCRIYSALDPGLINANFGGTCLGARCLRNYTTLGGFGGPGGYPCNGENTVA